MNIFFGIFLIAHGLIHSLYFLSQPRSDPNYPFDLKKGWVIKKFGPKLYYPGLGLVVLSIFLFVLSGIFAIIFGLDSEVWKIITLISALISSFLFLLFWHKWLIFGLLINISLIIIIISF